MAGDPLQRAATAERLQAISAAGGLSRAALARALQIASESPPLPEWRVFLSRSLLFLGSALMLCGVIFFFAFNWSDLGRFQKLGLLELAVAGAAVAAWQLGRNAAGQAALTAAAVLVGPLLAVYGQIYQTGADPYELFAGWAVLVLPWVVLARAPSLWVLELALWNVALPLYWGQVLQLRDEDLSYLVAPLLAVLDGAAWLTYEALSRRGVAAASARWPARLFALAGIGASVPGTVYLIFDPGEAPLSQAFSVALLAVYCAAAYLLSRRAERRDLFVLAMAGAALLLQVGCFAGRIIFKDLDLEEAGVFLLGCVVLAEVGGLVMWLRRMGSAEVEEG